MTASTGHPIPVDQGDPPLSAPLTLSFDYTRSVGPVLSEFYTALQERRILGVRGSDGRVYAPPVEYDPITYAPLSEFVEVAAEGTVVSWSWQAEPLDGQPLNHPFAWALIRLDGADVPMLHAVDVPGPHAITTGDRVRVHWADDATRFVVDAKTDGTAPGISHFVPAGAADGPDFPVAPRHHIEVVKTLIGMTIQHSASHPETAYLKALQQGRLLGARTAAEPGSDPGKVYFPAREADPATGLQLTELVEVADKGTVTTFAIINIPFAGQRIEPPYVAAYVLLDGADIPFLTLVADVDAHDVRMGMRVEAVWKPREDWIAGMENIEYFRPSGEPDAEYDTYKHHL